jgi:GT2 family glycosyltransferase
MKRFVVEVVRFHLYEPNRVLFTGWFYPLDDREKILSVYLDKEKLDAELEVKKGVEVRQKHIQERFEINEEISGSVLLPDDWTSKGELIFYCGTEGDREKVRSLSVKELLRLQQRVEFNLENVKLLEHELELTGWAAGTENVTFSVLGSDGNDIPFEHESYLRRDVANAFPEMDEEQTTGFKIMIPLKGKTPAANKKESRGMRLVMEAGDRKSVYQVDFGDDKDARTMVSRNLPKKVVRYLSKYGFKATVTKSFHKIFHIPDLPYDYWWRYYQVKEEELQRQRECTFEHELLFSIAIPLYRTNEKFLREMIESIRSQTYTKWELCMADGSGKDSPLIPILKEYAAQDSRIRYKVLAENEGISGNTNEALAMASGDVIVLADHDDIVPANALYELARAWNEDETIDVLYSDEDKISMDGKRHFDPHFKSDYNIDLLCSMNYVCHLFAFKKEILAVVKGQKSEFDGAQDYDFILRCFEAAQNIRHIPKILYHWRCHVDSTAENPESKLYAFEAGKRAIEAHYERLGIPAHVEHSQFYGMYHTIYDWKEQPLVSILIPNKDHTDDLEKSLTSIQKQNYTNYEVIIIENNSTEEETFAYYKNIENEKIHVAYYDGDFNFSKINNFGARQAKGEYFLLLNNDTEMIREDCLKELLGYCMRPDVGAVGARLYYGDDTIQHAGVVLGFGGIAGHTFIGKSRYDIGYFGRIICAQDYSAVTAACTMTKREVFWQVGGLTEELRVAFNDIDYCMKVRQTGKLIVYNPYAELYHYESKSRGLEDTPEKIARFNSEVALFNERWGTQIEAGDPYYNPNLTLNNSDFSIRM